MMRLLHRWPGLVLAVLLCVTAGSGAALSVLNAREAVRAPQAADAMTVAELAQRVQATHPGLEQIKRAPSGQITAWWFDGSQPGSAVVDPATGRDVASADPDPLQRWLTSLHRALLLGDVGRLATAAGALAMLVLAVTGAVLVARRNGGWRRWFARQRGPLAGRLHTDIARFALAGLLLSTLTGLWMSAETFELVTIEPAAVPAHAPASGRPGLAPAAMLALLAIPVGALRELGFPARDDPQDVYTLKTDRGVGAVDPGTGALLSWQEADWAQRLSETIAMLHTGQGAAVLGLALGLMACGVPVLAVTGVLTWFEARRARPRLRGNAAAAAAQTVVLVGSESGSTWGFAATLASALRAAGQAVHLAPMNGFAPARHRQAQRFVVLAATYGDGTAPASAKDFLQQLQALSHAPAAPLAVLGFGDRGFPNFCTFASAVDAAARAKGWPMLLPLHTVDRQSPQAFAQWGRALGQALGIGLDLVHQPAPPTTQTLTLLDRRAHGAAVQVPMAILRFGLPKATPWQRLTGQGFARFEPGDLLGVVPDGSPLPRLYSLASGSEDGFIEIVVRQQPDGLCSNQLMALVPGQTVQAFLRRNPAFHVHQDLTPLILIGAGTGIGPLAGFIRGNRAGRPIHLFFGLRNPDSDFLYGDELAAWQAEGRLARLSIAVSRGDHPQHVQDVLGEQAPKVVEAIGQGARIMVCGGRQMARGVADVLTRVLEPTGLTPAMLKAADRYVEDVY